MRINCLIILKLNQPQKWMINDLNRCSTHYITMSLNIQALVSRYVNKIEVIGHKKSLIVEIRLHTTGEEQYKQLFNALSNLNLDNLAEMAMVAQSKLNALGVSNEVMEKAEKEVKDAKK